MISPMRGLLALLLLATGCEDAPPAWCQPSEPLQLTCQGPHCVAAVVVDYKRLEPRGYRVFALAGQPIDEKQGEALALEHLRTVYQMPPPDQVEARRDLSFINVSLYYQESGDSWLVVLHAPTGQLLFAGREEWASAERRGYDFALPEGFHGPAGLGCQRGAAEPRDKLFITTGIPLGTAPASTALEAWRLVRGLNLTARLTGERPYQVVVISYAPAVGEFDPESADWYVWIYRL